MTDVSTPAATSSTVSSRSGPRTVHIMGAAGSGKTTLACRLGQKLDIPWHDLDMVAYYGGYGRKHTLAERQAGLRAIMAQPAWVTEGTYLWWIDDLLEAAEIIVWLDFSWYVSMPRVITRHFRLSWAGQNRHPGLGKLARFVWHCRRYYLDRTLTTPPTPDTDSGINRTTVRNYLRPYMSKVVWCRRPYQVDQFVQSL